MFPRFRRARRITHMLPTDFLRDLAVIREDRGHVVVELFRVGVTNLANLIDNRIIVHGAASLNSSGVQIVGGPNPAAAQTLLIFLRMLGLAICLKFHVTKYSIPFTAARAICAASSGSVVGTAL